MACYNIPMVWSDFQGRLEELAYSTLIIIIQKESLTSHSQIHTEVFCVTGVLLSLQLPCVHLIKSLLLRP